MDLAEKWKTAISPSQGKLRVGLAWAGRPTHGLDRHRSIALAEFAPLGNVEGIEFVSLQTDRSDPVPPGLSLIDLTENLTDFAETAALIVNLDLVITVDTAVAHLAGAIGKPVWLLLMKYPEWRWQLDRDDSPWYSSMKLFRQTEMGQWKDVIHRIGIALAERQS